MAKKTMLELKRAGALNPEYAQKIALDYKKASEVWSEIIPSKIESVDELVEIINQNEETFLNINSTGTWEDAMTWTALMHYYDAQTGLQFESGMHAQNIIDAFKKSDCSTYVRKTIDYAYYILRDQKVTRKI